MALSTLITLLFNSTDILFDEDIFNLYISSQIFDFPNLYFLLGYENIIISKWISIIVLIVVCVGIYPRYTGIFHWWIAYSFLKSSAIIEGGNQLNSIITFLIIPITLLDKRGSHWKNQTNIGKLSLVIGNSFLFVVQIQMAILYLNAAIEKIYKLNEWVEGCAIYYILNDSLFGAPDWINYIFNPIINSSYGSFILSWGTIFLEFILFSSIFIVNQNKKKMLFIMALLFHFMIAITFGLISFFLAMAGGLTLYLIPSDYNFKNKVSFIKSN